MFVAQYSHPLNYKSSLSDFQVRTENNHLRFAFQKEREVTVLPVTPSRILFILFTIDHLLFMVDTGIRTLFLRCTDGRFTDKLEPTTVVEFGFEPKPPVSKTDMLTITLLNIFCGSYENRTHSNRSTICDVSHYTNEPFVARTRFELVSSQ